MAGACGSHYAGSKMALESSVLQVGLLRTGYSMYFLSGVFFLLARVCPQVLVARRLRPFDNEHAGIGPSRKSAVLRP